MVFSEKWLKNHPNFITVSDTNSDLKSLYYDHLKSQYLKKSWTIVHGTLCPFPGTWRPFP